MLMFCASLGTNIRNMTLAAGGSDERLSRIVRFPSQDSQESLIVVEGERDVVEKICSSIDAFVKKLENRIVEAVEVPQSRHVKLIGRGGEVRRNIESQFDVTLDIPRKDTQGPAGSSVRLLGTPEDVERAKEHILKLVAENEGETVDVPKRFHHAISDNGRFFRQLRSDYNVTVDHAGQRPPATSQTHNRANGNIASSSSLPLITDDTSSSANLDHHSWEVIDTSIPADSNDEASNGTIPWVLHGSPDSTKSARAALDRALANASSQTTTGYLILPDPRTYRLVVGPKGTQVDAIRKKTGTRVNVPKDQSRREAIEIRGDREGVEGAKEMILEVVRGAGGR